MIYHCFFILLKYPWPLIKLKFFLWVWWLFGFFLLWTAFFISFADFSRVVSPLLFEVEELFEIYIADFQPLIFLSCKDYFSESKLAFCLYLWYFCHKNVFIFIYSNIFSFSLLDSRVPILSEKDSTTQFPEFVFCSQ